LIVIDKDNALYLVRGDAQLSKKVTVDVMICGRNNRIGLWFWSSILGSL